MLSAWNWLGIIVWLIIIAYFFWMIDNVHSRKKRLLKTALSNRQHELTSSVAFKNFELTTLEVMILIVLLIGMGHTTFHHHISNHNSVVTSRVRSLDYTHTKINVKQPTAKIHYYYVKIDRSKAKNLQQKYGFKINGQNQWANNTNAIVTTNPDSLRHNLNLPKRINRIINKKIKRIKKHQACAVQIATRYKNSPANGLGLHAGQKVFYYTILRVPGHSGIYVNEKIKKAMK